MTRSVLILGANGFIGSHLSEYLLAHRDYEVYAMDLHDTHLGECIKHPRYHFTKGNITVDTDWVKQHVHKCDVILPLVAIANPALYVKNPLAVFELDFVANLDIIRTCVEYQKRVIFPSTSEVYGLSPDLPYDEETSTLVTGPIHKERWIYSCSKQLMDRVIYAFGGHRGLDFTLFRPFNWFGPRLDNVQDAESASSRVVTQFLSNIIHRRDIVLVGGGEQRRTFLYVSDAIDALTRVIDNKDGEASGRIFNIGHPQNDISIAELAEHMLTIASSFKGYENIRKEIKIVSQPGEAYYGKGYQDVTLRVPKIENARAHLGWSPSTAVEEGLRRTIGYYLG